MTHAGGTWQPDLFNGQGIQRSEGLTRADELERARREMRDTGSADLFDLVSSVNWTNDDVFAARDRTVVYRDGRPFTVKLYADGWALVSKICGDGPEGMDIWAIRAVLNNAEARLL